MKNNVAADPVVICVFVCGPWPFLQAKLYAQEFICQGMQ